MIKPLNKTKVPSQPWEDVLALNVPPARYVKLFEAEPPEHLGINLALLASDTSLSQRIQYASTLMVSVGMTMRAMLEYDDFQIEFAPANMVDYTVVGNVFPVSDGLLDLGLSLPLAPCLVTAVAISFFDSEKGYDEDSALGCAIATHVLNRIEIAAKSSEPKDHLPLTLTAAAAAEYRKRVGDLYDTERGIWCRELVQLARQLNAGVQALLDERPLVQAMRNPGSWT